NDRGGDMPRLAPMAPLLWSSSPFGALQRIASEMDRVFTGFGFGPGHGELHHFSPWRTEHGPVAWSPAVEVFERDDRLVVRAELPGLSKDDVHVEIAEDAITIEGQRHHEHEEKHEGYYHSERSYGSFYRTIALPEG